MRAVAMRSWLAKSLMIVLLVDVGGYSATAQTGELAALNRQVEELYYDGKYGEAAALAERSLKLTRAQKGQNHLETADSMYWVALVYHSQGRYSEAEPLLKRTLAIREKALGRDAYSVGTVLNKLANLYEILGRYSEAEPIYKRALAISEKLRGPDDLEVGTALNNLAVLYGSQGRMRDAESFHKRALTVYEKSLGPDHFLVGNSLNNLAVVYSSQGRGREAEPLYKRALAVYERARGPDDPIVGGGLNSLAELYRDQGRYAEAEPLYKRALAIREKALGPDNEAVAASLNNLAALYFSQGRARDAEPLFKRALVVYEKAFGPDHPHLGHALNNLAALYSYLGQDGEAEPLYKRVLAISAKALGPDDPGVGTPLNNLAILYRNQGRFNEAEQLYKRALAVLEKALGADHALVGSTLGNLGQLYQAQGRDGEAELLYKRDLTISEKALGLDHPSIGTTLDYLAGLYLLQKDWKRAADTWRRSTGVIVHRAQRGMGGGGETLMGKGKSEATRSSYQFFGLVKMVHRLATDGREADASLTREMFLTGQWAQASEAASSLAQMAARGATGDAGLSRLVRERQDLIADWQKRDGVRSAAVSQAPDKRNRAAETVNLAQLTEIEKQLADIDQRLKSDFPDYAALSQPEPLSVEQVQADLRSDEALVMFLDTPERKPTPEETFIWVVTKSDMRWVRSELGTPALTREVAALRCGLDATAWTGSSCFDLTGKVYTDADRAGGKPLPFDHTRAHKLYTALFGEVADLIKGKHLQLVPSGPLTQLPFQVLVTEQPKGGDHKAISWLARDNALTVLPAVSSLKALRRIAKPSAATLAMIGFGNPLLDGDHNHPQFGSYFKEQAALARAHKDCAQAVTPRTAVFRGPSRSPAPMSQQTGLVDGAQIRRLTPLPETADELCTVARDLKSDVNDIRLGARATEREVKRLSAATDATRLANYHILHFATHGTLAGQLSGTSEPGLILTPPDKATSEDDGYLSASEIAGLKLDADWVILSACNTAGPASGGDAGAEALGGLARAFFYAQARALLVSHWEVNSEATVKLITASVRAITNDPSVGRAEALRRAMLAMIDKGEPKQAHPSYWAPFVVVGEGAAAR